MPDYSLYQLTSDNRVVAPSIKITVADDKAAFAEAFKLCHAAVVEVWRGARFLTHVNPAHRAAKMLSTARTEKCVETGREPKEALRNLANTERDIIAFAKQINRTNAKGLVDLRLQLVVAFAKVGTALENDPLLTVDPDLKTRILRLFSAFRSQNSINQANWSAVRVRDDLQNYLSSSDTVAVASRAFWGCVDNVYRWK